MTEAVLSPDARELANIATEGKAVFEKMRKSYDTTINHALILGEHLIRAKELCGHGGWLAWLGENFELGERAAQKYMMLAREAKSNPKHVSDLPLRDVRKGLALPAAPKAKQTVVPDDSPLSGIIAKGEEKPPDGEPEDDPIDDGERERAEALAAETDPPDPEPIVDASVVEDEELVCPGVLTVAEERKWDVYVQQATEARALAVEAGAEGLGAEAVMNALRDSSRGYRRAQNTLEELAQSVEKRV